MQILNVVVRHPCPYSGPVQRLPGARVTHLCHRGREAFLEVHASVPKAAASLVTEYERIGGKVLYEEADRSAAFVRFPVCACCASGRVIPAAEGAGDLYLPPSSYSSEGEHYQFLAHDPGRGPNLAERLPDDVSLVRAATKPLASLAFEDGFLVPVGVLLEQLTDRQRQAVLSAVLRGYYRIPRAVTTGELARGFGISRPAFDALLRKAENKFLTALFPYLAARGPDPAA